MIFLKKDLISGRKIAITSIICLTLMLTGKVYAEMIYLKDGQVLQGKITKETQDEITVQTQFQKKTVKRSNIIRIMYGERKMERIYLLMNDGTTRTGFLVDQDASQVIIREKEDSPDEISIPKSQIKQMSASEEIIPLEPSIAARAGYFIPLNSKGAKLKPALCIFAGSDMNLKLIKQMRFMFEAGYAKCKGETQGLSMQFIPVLASVYYDISFRSFHIMPEISAGGTVIDFNDGEGESLRSLAVSGAVSAGFVYEIIDRHLYAGLWPEYFFMRDGSGNLHSMAITAGVSYRF
jgi:hypothetical protein